MYAPQPVYAAPPMYAQPVYAAPAPAPAPAPAAAPTVISVNNQMNNNNNNGGGGGMVVLGGQKECGILSCILCLVCPIVFPWILCCPCDDPGRGIVRY